MSSISPINTLQELMLANGNMFPIYTFENSATPPGCQFLCNVEVEVSGKKINTEGTGRTKREAKHNAAERMLISLGHASLRNKDESKPENYMGRLNEYASMNRMAYPVYLDSYDSEMKLFKAIIQFNNFETVGLGVNKKGAKQIAARGMMHLLCSPRNISNEQLPPKKLERDELDSEAMKRFEELSLAVSTKQKLPVLNSSKKQNVSSNEGESEEKQADPNFRYTLDEAEKLLAKNNVKYTTTILQNSPKFMIMIEIGSQFTTIGSGDHKRNAETQALNQAILMLEKNMELK